MPTWLDVSVQELDCVAMRHHLQHRSDDGCELCHKVISKPHMCTHYFAK